MSIHDVISLMLQFGSFLSSTLNLIVIFIDRLMDNKNKKK